MDGEKSASLLHLTFVVQTIKFHFSFVSLFPLFLVLIGVINPAAELLKLVFSAKMKIVMQNARIHICAVSVNVNAPMRIGK